MFNNVGKSFNINDNLKQFFNKFENNILSKLKNNRKN